MAAQANSLPSVSGLNQFFRGKLPRPSSLDIYIFYTELGGNVKEIIGLFKNFFDFLGKGKTESVAVIYGWKEI